MKIVVFMVNRETKELSSYKIYDFELDHLEKKVNEYNQSGKDTEAIIITDKLTVDALVMKESVDTIESSVKNLLQEFEDLKRVVSNTLDNVGYMINTVGEEVKKLAVENKSN